MVGPRTSCTTRSSAVLELPSPLAVVCHDAGAANVILAWLGASELDCHAVMQGPAARLWVERFGTTPMSASLDVALDGAAALLSGTGWASSVEHEARGRARERGIRSIAVIDHWVNYAERFRRDGRCVWPDEFWVTDEYAVAEAARCFPGQMIRLQPNLYLDQQLQRIPAASGRADLLYVVEPARDTWGRDRLGEFQALDYFMERRTALDLPARGVIRLRPHPSDPEGKYDDWLAGHRGVQLDESPSLADAIGACAWVAGAESFALVVALQSGRRVVCTLPPWAPACRLPQRGLIHLKEIA